MYKTLEITEIIGSAYIEGYSKDSISFNEIREIMAKVNEVDQFVSFRLSRQAMNRALILADQDLEQRYCHDYIVISKDKAVHSRFIREYYKLDYDTRFVLSEIVKEFIHNGKI